MLAVGAGDWFCLDCVTDAYIYSISLLSHISYLQRVTPQFVQYTWGKANRIHVCGHGAARYVRYTYMYIIVSFFVNVQ